MLCPAPIGAVRDHFRPGRPWICVEFTHRLGRCCNIGTLRDRRLSHFDPLILFRTQFSHIEPYVFTFQRTQTGGLAFWGGGCDSLPEDKYELSCRTLSGRDIAWLWPEDRRLPV